MAPSRLHCLIITLFLYLCQSQRPLTNQYTESIGTNGESIWQSTSDFVPVQGQSFGQITLGRQISMKFDFIFNGRSNSPNTNKYEMFFRVGFDSYYGNGCSGHGSRYPSLWLRDKTEELHLSVSDGVGCSQSQALTDYGVLNKGIPHHVHISFNDSLLTFHISGGGKDNFTESWSRTPTLQSHIGKTANVWWMSSKFGYSQYNRGNGTFSNIVIISSDFGPTEVPTNVPTANPSAYPTTIPTAIPTANPIEIPTTFPSNNPSADPTSTPSADPTSSPSIIPNSVPTVAPSTSSVHISSQTTADTTTPTAVTLSATNTPSTASDSVFVSTVNEAAESAVEFGYYGGKLVYMTMSIMLVMLVCCCTICVCRDRYKFYHQQKRKTSTITMANVMSHISYDDILHRANVDFERNVATSPTLVQYIREQNEYQKKRPQRRMRKKTIGGKCGRSGRKRRKTMGVESDGTITPTDLSEDEMHLMDHMDADHETNGLTKGRRKTMHIAQISSGDFIHTPQ